jgi:hypothetical protein
MQPTENAAVQVRLSGPEFVSLENCHNTSDADARLPKSLTQSVTARLDARSSESGRYELALLF